MQPSSVIFLVLLGVWAAYFALYWVRRREHLATARTADQLSASMRVLERRAPVVHAEPTPRSYAASPTRAVPGGLRVGLALTPTDRDREDTAPASRVRVDPMRPSRRTRGVTLLLGLVATVLAVPVAAWGSLPWPALAAPGLVALAGFAWLRAGVQAQIRVRRLTAEAGRVSRASIGTAAAAPTTVTAENRDEVADLADSVAEPVTEAAPEIVVARPAGPLVDEDDIPLTWEPVPVPKPTYAMKAKAERATPPPAETTPTPEPVTLEDAAYAEPERRVAGA